MKTGITASSASADPACDIVKIRTLELEGVVHLGPLLQLNDREAILADSRLWDLKASSYSDSQTYIHGVQWLEAMSVFAPLRSPRLMSFLQCLFADRLVCTGISFSRISTGYPGMALHCDGKPGRSQIFGPQASCPAAVRVLVYLDGTDAGRAPLKVVRGSHLSLHAEANPFLRYSSHEAEEDMLCLPGEAIIIHHRVFHRAGRHNGGPPRHLISYGFRPAWAGPLVAAPTPSAEALSLLPADIKPFFEDPNVGMDPEEAANYSADFRASGDGLSRIR
ncbi:phytanoyl-CoA dioxygenase family protein [Bauldia litoralis]|nr:phytanoyl-CoA dioxygenase family protein [Bauldia litoralis]